MSMYSNIYHDDIYEKKRVASGANYQNKRGKGKMFSPVDLLKGKAKKDYIKNGKVRVFNMYDEIMSYDEFKALGQDGQVTALTALRKKHTNLDIMKAWDVDNYVYYQKLLKPLGIIPNNKKAKKEAVTPEAIKTVPAPIQEAPAPTATPEAVPAPSGLSININGSYDAVELVSKLEKLGLILDDGDTYKVDISIVEVENE